MQLLKLIIVLLAFAGLAQLRLLGDPRERSTVPAASPVGRFVVQDAGQTVFDRVSGLHWQQGEAATLMTWAAAKTWCANNTPTLPGVGWRMPTIGELQQLIDRQAPHAPYIDDAFASTSNQLFWTTSPAEPNFAWLVRFQFGYTSTAYVLDAGAVFTVRCVR